MPYQADPPSDDAELQTVLATFVEQARTGSSLYVSNYPKWFRGLRVKVSFGRGTPARVPWVGFLGQGHSPSGGCYPALLYFKSASTLAIAYAVSEQFSGRMLWEPLLPLPTISDVMASELGRTPERYGSSFAAELVPIDKPQALGQAAASLTRVIDAYCDLINRGRTTTM